jgi:hypothetical protein
MTGFGMTISAAVDDNFSWFRICSSWLRLVPWLKKSEYFEGYTK